MIYVNSITINATNKQMTVGKSQFISATIYPENATKKSVSWSSSNTSIVTVNEISGLVMAHGEGSATIKATALDGSGVVGTCDITVSAPIYVENITLSSSSLALFFASS